MDSNGALGYIHQDLINNSRSSHTSNQLFKDIQVIKLET